MIRGIESTRGRDQRKGDTDRPGHHRALLRSLTERCLRVGGYHHSLLGEQDRSQANHFTPFLLLQFSKPQKLLPPPWSLFPPNPSYSPRQSRPSTTEPFLAHFQWKSSHHSGASPTPLCSSQEELMPTELPFSNIERIPPLWRCLFPLFSTWRSSSTAKSLA